MSAQVELGYIYRDGDGVEVNYEEANKWFVKATEHDDPDAWYAMAKAYYKIAPQLVEKLENNANKQDIYREIYSRIQQIVKLVNGEANDEAIGGYLNLLLYVEKMCVYYNRTKPK